MYYLYTEDRQMELRNYRSRRVAGAVVNDNDYDESRRHHIYACHPSLVGS